jgi:hypothetical protein
VGVGVIEDTKVKQMPADTLNEHRSIRRALMTGDVPGPRLRAEMHLAGLNDALRSDAPWTAS